MDLTRLRNDLHHYLHDGLHKHRGPSAELDQLIETLAKKDADLQRQLALEKDPLKRRHLQIELKVTRLQHSKGLARRLELQDDHG